MMAELEQPEQQEELFTFDARRYLKALRRYIFPVLALVALAITAAVIYTSKQTKVYEAKASVQIEPRLRDLLGQGEHGVLDLATNGADYYNQQLEVLNSHAVAKQTVKRTVTKQSAREPAIRKVGDMLLDPAHQMLKQEEKDEIAVARLQSTISVASRGQNRTLYVTVRHEDPEFAAAIANAHVASYVDYTAGILGEQSQTASKALQDEFSKTAQALQDAETDLFKFQKKNEILTVALDERQKLASTSITSFTVRMNEARARRIELASKLARMQKASEKDVLESPILMMGDSASFDVLRAQYYTERNVFLQMEKELGPKNLDYQKQKSKVDNIYNALQSEARRIVGGVQEQHAAALAAEMALASEVERHKQQVEHLMQEAFDLGPKVVVGLNEKLRAKKAFEDEYSRLRSRLSASESTERIMSTKDNTANDKSNVKPLDEAQVPTVPVSPKLSVNIAFATVLSLMLGMGLVFLSVFLDRTVKNTTDAQQAAGVPVLGIVPTLGVNGDNKGRDLYVHQHPKSLIAECCRALRTNILFSAAERNLKTLIVSSANQREGKTTLVIYLGTTMAQGGQRVLLIDTDMRRPRLHSSLGVSRQSGLSNLILGDQDYDQVIKTTDIPNLYVLPCGPLPPNPAELLMTKRFEAVLAELGNRFDRIILDSPPVQAVTDAVVLSKLADGAILVVRADKTLREDIRRSVRQMRDVGGRVVGAIVNEVEAGDRSYYGYGYGYGADEVEAKNPEPATTGV